MASKIIGSGIYLPKNGVDNTVRQPIGRRYGNIHKDDFDLPKTVHICDENETSTFIGAEAVKRAIEDANLAADKIDLLLGFSTDHDMYWPKDAQNIAYKAGLSKATAMDVDLGCSSFISLLKTADAFIHSGHHKNIVCVTTATWVNRSIDHNQDYRPLGDGAGAIVLTASDQNSLIHTRDMQDPRFFGQVRMNSAQLTGSKDVVQFNYDETFRKFIKSECLSFVKEELASKGYDPKKIDWFLCHQGSGRVMKHWMETLELEPEKLLSTYDEIGNSMASNIPITLHRHWKEGKIKRGDILLLFSVSMAFHSSMMLWRF